MNTSHSHWEIGNPFWEAVHKKKLSQTGDATADVNEHDQFDLSRQSSRWWKTSRAEAVFISSCSVFDMSGYRMSRCHSVKHVAHGYIMRAQGFPKICTEKPSLPRRRVKSGHQRYGHACIITRECGYIQLIRWSKNKHSLEITMMTENHVSDINSLT